MNNTNEPPPELIDSVYTVLTVGVELLTHDETPLETIVLDGPTIEGEGSGLSRAGILWVGRAVPDRRGLSLGSRPEP